MIEKDGNNEQLIHRSLSSCPPHLLSIPLLHINTIWSSLHGQEASGSGLLSGDLFFDISYYYHALLSTSSPVAGTAFSIPSNFGPPSSTSVMSMPEGFATGAELIAGASSSSLISSLRAFVFGFPTRECPAPCSLMIHFLTLRSYSRLNSRVAYSILPSGRVQDGSP